MVQQQFQSEQQEYQRRRQKEAPLKVLSLEDDKYRILEILKDSNYKPSL